MWERRQARCIISYLITDRLSPALKTKREIRERPKARLKIDKTLAVKHSDFVARTPPVETTLRLGN
jgi:hypothetical protein